MGEEASETGKRSRGSGAKRGVGSRLRASRQQVQGRAVEAERTGSLYRWSVNTRPEEKGGNRLQKICLDHSKGGKWGESKETEGEGKRKIQKTVDNKGRVLVSM